MSGSDAVNKAIAARDLAGVEGRANANAARRKYWQEVLPDLRMDAYVDHLVVTIAHWPHRKREYLRFP